MFKNLNRCDVFILLWTLYHMQGILYPQGVINQLLQLMMIFWAGIESVKAFFVQSPILKITLALLLMYCVYGLWIILSDSVIIYADGHRLRNYVYLQAALKSLLPIYMFYYYAKKGFLDERKIRIYVIVFLALSLKSFFQNKYLAFIENDREESTNNAAYGFINLIPLMYFFYKKPIIQYLLLGVLGMFMIMGMKRGAILIGGFSILMFLYSNFRGAVSRKRKIITFIFTFSIIAGAIYYISHMLQNSDYFVYRLEQMVEGNSSGRDIIYASLLDIFLNEPNILYVIFGHGAYATIELIGIEAHNDWLETLINNGLFGGIILLLFFICLTKTALKQRRRFPTYMYYSFLVLIFITWSKTMFSMSIQNLHIVQSLLLGYFVYWSTRPKEEIENQESTHT